MSEDIAIATTDLTRRFGRITAVDRLSLTIPRGCIYGFLGPNGSGKTTAIRMLCGLLSPSSGTASVLGFSMPNEAERLRLKAGYMTQKFSLYDDLSVLENFEFVGQIYGLGMDALGKRIAELTHEYHLADFINQRAGNMSGGQRQRLALAAATLHQPELLFLDEPTSAVDPQSRRDFWDSLFDISDRGATILVSTHFMDEAERCHYLGILDQGVLVAEGTPRQLIDDLGAHVFEISSDEPARAKELLESVDGIMSTAQLGVQLRVLIERKVSSPVNLVEKSLSSNNISARILKSRPNLEDVFVVATRAHCGMLP